MPNVVKGSKQHKMVVVPHRPARRFVSAMLITLGVLATAAGGFGYGYYTTISQQQGDLAERVELQQQIAALQAENGDLRRQITILDRSSQMDQRANEEVQSTISGLRNRVAQLEQEIVYYRQQDADGDTYLIGHANVNLIGTIDGEQQIVPLRDISDDVEQLDMRLRFRYFQNIEGELALPEGFTPERVQIAAVADEPVEKNISQNFTWVVEGE